MQFHCVIISLQVGADGANSMVRKQMNVSTVDIKYNQMGLIATVELCEVSICTYSIPNRTSRCIDSQYNLESYFRFSVR